MNRVKTLALILFLILPIGAQTLSEKIQSLQDFKINQDNFNRDEHGRNEHERTELEARLQRNFAVLEDQQRQQNSSISDIERSATELKFLGVIVLFLAPLVVAVWIRQQKEKDKVLDRLAGVEQSVILTKSAMPLLIEVADRLSSVLIEGVHHPDPAHAEADSLLDKLPSSLAPSQAALSSEDHEKLTELMRERANDERIGRAERNMARQLMPVLNAVRTLRDM